MRDHLDYLKDLGVTGVWMTPVYRNSASNSGGAYHGYSTVDYYDVEPRFGTMKEFKELVDAAHKIGIKVVQDQVANHCGPRHPWNADPPTKTWFNNTDTTPKPRNNYDIASLSDPYARPSRRAVPVRGWFAGSLPDLNQDDPLVSDYEIQNAVWWIGMTGIDGVRRTLTRMRIVFSGRNGRPPSTASIRISSVWRRLPRIHRLSSPSLKAAFAATELTRSSERNLTSRSNTRPGTYSEPTGPCPTS